ncbi:ATP-binding protein [Desertivirga arenae]|uniref:ATP-binding protein n=1 Tax=Desertivirga arenae TaxID=2810309 RepID=UPI001A97B7C0|nr:ATP-binding protein [Pedobacter sp. SYSU D00823]
MKGKVIIAFLSGCIALFFAWEASRQVSIEIFKNVDSLSTPVDRLHRVNFLFREINHLEQLQRTQAILGGKQDTTILIKKSARLRASLDTLQSLYAKDSTQSARIGSMKKILKERDSLFSNYMKVREGLVSSKELTVQLKTLTNIYSNSPVLIEKVITTERTSTVAVNTEDEEIRKQQEKEKKTFLGRIFGKKKRVKDTAQIETRTASTHIPHEELESETVAVKIDTLKTKVANTDSIKRELDKASRTIVSTQKLKSTSFVNREAALMNTGNLLINQMLNILQEVEKDAVRQVDRNNSDTKKVIESGANRIINIILLFVLATAILLYLILTDISKSSRYRKQLELAKDEAERHSAVRQRFLANMSHEIRTPLQSIIGYSEQLLNQPEPRKEDIEAIHYSSEHLLQIVNEILDYSRLASGKFSLNYTVFNLHGLLGEIIAVMRPQAEKKSVALVLQDTSSADYVKGDSFRLKQILYNLLSNAIKFTSEGSVILSVKSSDVGKRYIHQFSVQDTGAGIPKDSLVNIFNQFEQVNTSSVAATSGTGLGLSIVKELVELQGGEIHVESEMGKGSCFTIELGFAKPKQNPVAEIEVQEIRGTVADSKVFVVDDDELILQLCSSILEKNNVTHHCFNSPLELLATIDHHEDVIVFADIRMPEMNGLDLCVELRKLSATMKIFALTAQALPEERQVILESGFDGILMKPFREADLMSLLRGGESPEAAPVITEVKNELDLSSVRMMTFGDNERLVKILHKYVDDSTEDIEQLVQLTAHDPAVAFLFHRLAGRSAQLGAARLASLMRELEILALNSENEKSPAVTAEDIKWVTEEVQDVIRLVKEEINHLSDTSPSYNKEFSDQY